MYENAPEIIPLGTSWEPSPPDFVDPVIEAYKKDVDRTLLRENLKLTPAERFAQFDRAARFFQEIFEAGERARAEAKSSAVAGVPTGKTA